MKRERCDAIADASICIWDLYRDFSDDIDMFDSHGNKLPKGDHAFSRLASFQNENGIAATRQRVVEWAHDLEEAWDAVMIVTAHGPDSLWLDYDFGFAPWFVANCIDVPSLTVKPDFRHIVISEVIARYQPKKSAA